MRDGFFFGQIHLPHDALIKRETNRNGLYWNDSTFVEYLWRNENKELEEREDLVTKHVYSPII